jgi:hypothetical protein
MVINSLQSYNIFLYFLLSCCFFQKISLTLHSSNKAQPLFLFLKTMLTNIAHYFPIADPTLMTMLEEEDGGVQFSHTTGELLGSMLRAGLVIDDLYDDVNEEGWLGRLGIPSFLAVRAHKGGAA